MTDKPQLPPLRLSEIEARARAATPGPWAHRRDGLPELNNQCDIVETADRLIVYQRMHTPADAAHIATMSPDVALRMVEAIRAAREYMRVRPADEDLTPAFQAATNALRAALSEIEE